MPFPITDGASVNPCNDENAFIGAICVCFNDDDDAVDAIGNAEGVRELVDSDGAD